MMPGLQKEASLIWEGHKAARHVGYWDIEKLHNPELLQPTGFVVSHFPVRIERASAGWIRAVAMLDGLVGQSALTVRICMAGCASCIGALPGKSMPVNSACTASDIQFDAGGWVIANAISATTRSTGRATNPTLQVGPGRSSVWSDRPNEPCIDASTLRVRTA
jgi:hypothetical protein